MYAIAVEAGIEPLVALSPILQSYRTSFIHHLRDKPGRNIETPELKGCVSVSKYDRTLFEYTDNKCARRLFAHDYMDAVDKYRDALVEPGESPLYIDEMSQWLRDQPDSVYLAEIEIIIASEM